MLMIDGQKFYVDKELATKYGLSVHWFRKARRINHSPAYYKVNGKVYYIESDVNDWFKKNMILHK